MLKKYSAETVIDTKNKIVMPGLVNSHTHIAMTIFRGLADDIKLQDWLHNYIFPVEAEFVNPETVKIGSQLAMIEMLHSGTTTFNDMYFFEDEVAKAAKEIGIRAFLCESLINFKTPNSKTPEEGIKYIKMLADKYKNDNLITVALSVHSPYTCSSELIVKAKKFADNNNLFYQIHVAETKWEFDTIMSQYNLTPVEYLDSLGVLDDKTIAAHCVWLTENDIKILAERKVGIAHNPECNMKISSGVAPIPELLLAGAEVGLGTDGVASNNNLNMFEEMHTMSLLHKLNKMNPIVVPAETIVRVGTIGSANVLGMANQIGSLEIGKKADIIIIDVNKANTTPIFNVYSTIVYSLSGTDVNDVIINGEIIMRNKNILSIKEDDVIDNVNEIADKIKLKHNR
jgi:5-methylthioadenosine/S-adenosylhomocysteine deaminase